MKRWLLCYTVLWLSSCKKNHDSPHPVLSPMRTALISHAWIQDSTGSFVNGQPATVIYPSPRVVYTFDPDKYYMAYESQPPYDTLLYEFDEPSRIYYWAEGDVKDTSRYLTVETLTNKLFVTSYGGNPKFYQWCHAR